MKLRNERYVPRKRRYTLLRVLDMFMIVAVTAMWLSHERLGIAVSDLFIISGLVLFALIVSGINRKKNKELEVSDEFLEKMRNEIGNGDYGGGSIFFNDEKK